VTLADQVLLPHPTLSPLPRQISQLPLSLGTSSLPLHTGAEPGA